MITAVCIVGMVALCVLLAWVEHKARLGEAVERAILEESERVAMVQRRRFVAFLRDQSHVAEQLAKCGVFGAKGTDQEMYLANVLDELAHDVAFGAAEVVADEVQS
jgi:hypothetical protein